MIAIERFTVQACAGEFHFLHVLLTKPKTMQVDIVFLLLLFLMPVYMRFQLWHGGDDGLLYFCLSNLDLEVGALCGGGM